MPFGLCMHTRVCQCTWPKHKHPVFVFCVCARLLPWQLMSSQFTLFHACGSGKPEELPAALNDMGPEREQHLDYRCFLDGKLCLPRSTLPCMGFSTTQQRKQGPEAASQTDQRKGKYRLHVFCQQYGLQFGILSLIHLIQTNKHKCLRLPLHEDAPSLDNFKP